MGFKVKLTLHCVELQLTEVDDTGCDFVTLHLLMQQWTKYTLVITVAMHNVLLGSPWLGLAED